MDKCCPKCFKKYAASVDRCEDDGSTLIAYTEKDLTGQVLDDRYTVLERIGRGGMGVVYKAEQHLIKREVALKVLRREVVQDENAVKRFLSEARAIATLSSPHTVTLYDFGVTSDGLLYYTMELLKGTPLSRMIRTGGPLAQDRAVRFLLQACDSLEEAHEHGILHRDLKPDNMFVMERRGQEDIKVLDFGIAKFLGAGGESVTGTGVLLGSPHYLSPEQATGNPVVPASDLYSLGVVLYEMLAGVPPFHSETPLKTVWAHVHEPLPPLRDRNPEVQVTPTMEKFLRKALEKDPAARFQTVAEFRAALPKDETAPSPTFSGPQWRPTNLAIPKTSPGSGVLASQAGGSGGSSPGNTGDLAAPEPPKPQRAADPAPVWAGPDLEAIRAAKAKAKAEAQPDLDDFDGPDEPFDAFTPIPSRDGGLEAQRFKAQLRHDEAPKAGGSRFWVLALLLLAAAGGYLAWDRVPEVRTFLTNLGPHDAPTPAAPPIPAPLPRVEDEPQGLPVQEGFGVRQGQVAPGKSLTEEKLLSEALRKGQLYDNKAAVTKAPVAPEPEPPKPPTLTPEQEREVVKLVTQGKREMRAGRYIVALARFDDALKKGGPNEEVQTLMAECEAKLKMKAIPKARPSQPRTK